MRAAVLSDSTDRFQIEEVEHPAARRGEVVVRIAACGVCHTDLHVMRGEVAFPRPCVLGHEVSGIVEEVGEDVAGLSPGDRVVSSFIMPCGWCRHCVRGHDDLCETFFAYNRLRGVLYDGSTRIFRRSGEPLAMYSMGGLAERCVVPATDVFHVPDGLDLRDAAILGCSVLTSLGATRNVARVRPGERVAVVAVGGIGLNLVQMARLFGAQEIIAVDLTEQKLELARRLGATHTVNASEHDPVEAVRELTGGAGVDVAFEALGSAATVGAAISMVDDGGRAVLVGIAPRGVTGQFEVAHLVRRKIQVLGSYGARVRTDMPLALELAASGRIELRGLITDRFALDDVNEAFGALSDGGIVGRAVIEM